MTGCPKCGKPGSLLAGINLYEGHRELYSFAFNVCFDHDMARKQGEMEWRPIESFRPTPPKPEWRVLSPWHRQIKIGNELLDYWPTKKKYRWRGETLRGNPERLVALLLSKA